MEIISGPPLRRLSRRAAALALGCAAALALGAGEAAAQGCPNVGPVSVVVDGQPAIIPSLYENLVAAGVAQGPTGEIYCGYGYEDRNNRHVVVHSPAITVVDDFVSAIEALHQGVGHLGVYVHAIDDWEPGSMGTFSHPHPLDLGQGVRTKGDAAEYITGEESYGIYARHTGEGRVGIDVRSVSVRTAGDYAHGVYAWQEGSYRLRRSGDATRARGAVVVNLIETERDRENRIRPLVGTRGDYADAVRAEYTRAPAYGHVAVTVEGYTIATGGIVPLGVVGTPRQPGAFDPARPNVAVDFSRPYVANANYDPDDPNSPQYYNIRLRDDLQEALYAGRVADVFRELGTNTPIFPDGVLEGDGSGALRLLRGPGAIDIRPHILVYLPVRNPDYDPDDPDSKEYVARTTADVIWNGRYFRQVDQSLATDVYRCQNKPTAAERNACFQENIYDRNRDGGNPTGFEARGIYASHGGRGDVRVSVTDSAILTWGADAHGIYARHAGVTITAEGEGGSEVVTEGGGEISVTISGGVIGTEALDAIGVYAHHLGAGGVSVELDEASIATKGALAFGVLGQRSETGKGRVSIGVSGGSIDTEGRVAYAVWGLQEGEGDVGIAMTGASIATKGEEAHGAFGLVRGKIRKEDGTLALSGGSSGLAGKGRVSITISGGSIATEGENAHGVHGAHHGEEGDVVITISDATISTKGGAGQDDAFRGGGHGVYGRHISKGGVSIDVSGGSIATEGDHAYGVRVLHTGTEGDISFRMTGGAISTTGAQAHAVRVEHDGDEGGLAVSLAGGSVAAAGEDAYGVHITMRSGGALTIGEGTRVSASSGVGVFADGVGDLDATIAGTVEGDLSSIATGGLTAMISGTVTGNVLGGDLDVSVPGTVTGNVHGDDLNVDVSAPGTVGGDIRANGDLDATIAGTVEGDVRADGDLMADVSGTVGGDVLGLGDGDHVVTVAEGGVVKNTIRLAASVVTIHGTAGRVWLENGGTVAVGAAGRITGVDGVAIRADGGALRVDLDLADRRLTDVLGGDIVNDPAATTLVVNGQTLRGGDAAVSGPFDVRLAVGDGRVGLSESYAPRAGIYETLPGLLLRLSGGKWKGERRTSPGSPVWASVLGGNGARGKGSSTAGAKYDFDHSGAEAGLGLSFPWSGGLSASLSVHQVSASADVSMGAGKGEIDLDGVGYGFGFSWKDARGWYVSGDFGLTDYEADLVSGSRGSLKHDADASVRFLDVEAGRRVTLERGARKIALTPRVWVSRASASVDGFTDSAGARFRLVEGDRFTGGVDVSAETDFLARNGGKFSLRGAVGLESALSGEKTSVEVSGYRLHAEAEKARVLLGLGARWRKGRFSIDGELNGAGVGSDDRTFGGRLNLGVAF